MVHESLVVAEPAVVSKTSRPPMSRCAALAGSIWNGVVNSGEVSAGLMRSQFLPPSVVTRISPPTYSS